MNKLTKNDIYKQIAELIIESRKQVRTAVNTTMVITYWNIGRIIVEDELKGEKRAQYGKATLKHLSEKLTSEFGEGYDIRNLQNMKKFYIYFQKSHAVNDQLSITNTVCTQFDIRDAVSLELSWSHYRHLLKVENEKVRQWYMKKAISENWSTRALERQINSFYYERLLSSQNKKPVIEEAKRNTKNLELDDIFKDPNVLEFVNMKSRKEYTETELETALLDNLSQFLLELGSGFSFVARQKHMDMDGEHFYIDLVFYNYKLKCFVLIDLKRGKLTHQDVGQMDSYVRIFEEKFRAEDDNPTIGLILCSEKNETIAKYSVLADGKKLFASKYKLYLPTEEQLEKLMVKEEMALYGKQREGSE